MHSGKNIGGIPALSFRRFTEQDALMVARWQYPEPYAAYDLEPSNREVLGALLRPENQYHAILSEGEVVGFFRFGEDARVPGWSYDDSALDLGMGLRPDLTGAGNGLLYFQRVLVQVSQRHPGPPCGLPWLHGTAALFASQHKRAFTKSPGSTAREKSRRNMCFY